MRFAGIGLLVVAIGCVMLFEYLEADQADKRRANAAALVKYREEFATYQSAAAAVDAAAAKLTAAVDSCTRDVERALAVSRKPTLALVAGPRAAARHRGLDVARCNDAVGDDFAVLAGSGAAIAVGATRGGGRATQTETVSPTMRRLRQPDGMTTLVITPATGTVIDAELRPWLLRQAPVMAPALQPPAPVQAAVLGAHVFRYVGIALGIVLGVGGVLVLARGSRVPAGYAQPIRSHALVPTTSRALAGADARMIAQLRVDLDDLGPFLRELFRVAVRLNPINRRLFQFHQRINTITEKTERADVCAIVKTAIMEIDLSNVVGELADFDETFMEEIGAILRGTYDELAKALPDYRQRIPGLPDQTAAARHSAARIAEALQSTRPQLAVIEAHYRQLRDYLPRYESLMTRTGLLDFLLGFAIGWFVGGDVADLGAELWDGWREQSDKQFLESFSRAVDQFAETAMTFTTSTEAAVEPVVGQAVDELIEAHGLVIGGLAALAAGGTDLRPVFQQLRSAERADPNTRELFNVVFANLREQGVSGRSERNLRTLLGA